MNATTLSCSSFEELEKAIEQTISSNFYPTIGVCFFSQEFDPNQISESFSRFKIDLLATTSCDEFTEAGITSNQIAVLLLDIDKAYYRMCFEESGEDVVKWGEKTAKFGKLHFSNPAFISLMDFQSCGDFFIEGVNKVIPDAPIFGGLAAVKDIATPMYVVVNDQVSKKASGTLIIDANKIEVSGEAISGWQSIGTLQTITRCEGNKIIEINGEKALTYFTKILGTYHESGTKNDNIMLESFQYPLQIMKEGESILRAPLVFNKEEDSIVVGGKVNEGDQFKFSYAPGVKVVKETIDKFKDFARSNYDVDAVIMFSCKARQAAFGPLISEEVKGIQQLWNKPMVGFFSFGEIGRNKSGKTYLYNETCSTVTFKEK